MYLNLKTLPSGPAARSAPKNFSTESEKFSGAAPPHVTRGMEGFEIQTNKISPESFQGYFLGRRNVYASFDR